MELAQDMKLFKFDYKEVFSTVNTKKVYLLLFKSRNPKSPSFLSLPFSATIAAIDWFSLKIEMDFN